LIDASYLAHRARNALKDLSHEDYPTGVLFGLLEQLRATCSDPKIESNRVLLCFDSKRSYRRKSYPEYKRGRTQDRTEGEQLQLDVMYSQMDMMRKVMFPAVGFQVAFQSGVESDDLMAYAAAHAKGKVIIVTADGDLYQCITDDVHFYDPGRHLYHTPLTFWASKGIEPHRWAEVKCIAGCSSDNVQGVSGVGEISAIDFLLGNMPKRYIRYQSIVNGEGVRERNRGLITLPHVKTRPFEFEEPCYQPDVFWSFCQSLGIESYLAGTRHTMWVRFFNNDFHNVKVRFRTRKNR